jgi:hypothetical protein
MLRSPILYKVLGTSAINRDTSRMRQKECLQASTTKDSDISRLAQYDSRVPNHHSGDLGAPIHETMRHPHQPSQQDISIKTSDIALEMIAHRYKAWELEISDATQVAMFQAQSSTTTVPLHPATKRTKSEMF